ncbi:MAG: SdpI family protein [Butyricicoccus sp.]|nr:SdpI family protein [Butyricicoccus sp.]
MGFWIIMLLLELLLPLVMLFADRMFEIPASGKVNHLYGYRTPMSMKNADTWQFANRYCARLWTKCGRIMLPASALVMLCVFGRDTDTVGTVGTVLCLVQIVPLLSSIFVVESALKRTFDKNGNRR